MTHREQNHFTLQELCEASGVTPRTVRYYIKQGLLQGASRSGPGVQYPAGHLWRLRLIRRLKDEHLPLAKIRSRLDMMSDSEIRALLEEASIDVVIPSDNRDSGSAADYIKQLLNRDKETPSRSRSRHTPGARPGGAQPGRDLIERSQWERIVVAPDVEIHVRRPQSRLKNKQIAEFIDLANQCFKESS